MEGTETRSPFKALEAAGDVLGGSGLAAAVTRKQRVSGHGVLESVEQLGRGMQTGFGADEGHVGTRLQDRDGNGVTLSRNRVVPGGVKHELAHEVA